MSRFLLLLTGILSFCISQTSAQNIIRCHTDEKAHEAYDDYDSFQKSIDKGLKQFNETPQNQKSSVVLTIPVHVIIVHPPGQAIGTGSNLSVARIQSQIDVLNEDFRRTNSDASNTPSDFAAADTEIEFCLAVVDENGNATDGITRYATNLNMNSSENAIKSATGWNRNLYLNMWSAPNLGGILGWAYLPSTTGLPNATLDGIVVATGSFGGPGQATNAPYHLGRTATHEVGHYLGLRHIWRNSGCGADDGFADTPLQDDENFGCQSHPSPSCSNGGDMFMNYMDYVNDNCMNAFTVDQGNYMQLILTTSRSSLPGSASTACNTTPPLEIDLVFSQDLLCNGQNTGSIEVSASGGTPPYEYSINNGSYQPTGIFNNLAAGVYQLTVLDANGTTNSLSVEIFQPEVLNASIIAINDNLCFGDATGSAFIELSGGTAPYFVNGQQVNGSSYAITNLPQGNYSALITDINQCTQTIDFTISQPLALFLSIDALNHVNCFGQTNGSFSYSVYGGTPTYTVKLNNSVLNSNIVTNLPAGDYELEVEDNNGCTYNETISIEQPDELLASSNIDQAELCLGAANGIATIITEGGTSPFSYFLDDNAATQNNVFENLESGMHQVNIIDFNGCSTSTTFNIEAGYALESVITNIENAQCGSGDGAASVLASEGTAPYTYSIAELNLSNQSGVFQDIAAGSYLVEISDINNCMTEQSFTIIEEAAAELEIIESIVFTCFGENQGAVTLLLQDANGTPSYSIDGENFQESDLFTELEAGDYTFYATDDIGCLSQINLTITEHPEIEYDFSIDIPLCAGNEGGSIMVSASGGSGDNYTYSLASAPDNTNNTGLFENLIEGTDMIIITDGFSCIQNFEFEIQLPEALAISDITTIDTDCYGSNTGSANFSAENNQGAAEFIVTDIDGNEVNPQNLFAGEYTVEVKDENGCSSSSTFEILDESPIEWEITESTDASCDGNIRGTASFQATTGVAPFTYTVGQNTNTTGEFDNFNAGTYELTITDDTGCSRIVQFTIGQLEAYEYDVEEITDVTCLGFADGTVTLLADGMDEYQYSLNGMENTTGFFTDLEVGIYPYEITNSENCVVYDTIEITEPSELSLAIEEEVVNDNDLTDITLIAMGGTPAYMYNINGGNYQDSPIFTDIPDGDHTFSIIDANGCELSFSQTILDIVNSEIESLQIIPNPFNNDFSIEMNLSQAIELKATILAIDGKLIKAPLQQKFNKGYQIWNIELNNIPSGVYFLKLSSEESIIHKKIVKK